MHIDGLKLIKGVPACGASLSMFVAVGMTLLLAGCSLPLPQAQADPTKFFVLSSPSSAAPVGPSAGAPAIRLRGVEIASYLRARPVIVRKGENELEFRDFARWGEPLEQGITRVLREELLARGAASAVHVMGTRTGDVGSVRYDLNVRVLACEGLANGQVRFHAMWELAPQSGGGAAGIRGEYRSTDLQWSTAVESTLAAALSQAVAGLAGDIAAKLKP